MFCWPIEHVLQGLHSRWPSPLRAARCFIQPTHISTSSSASHTWSSVTVVTVIPISAAAITTSIIDALV